MSYDEQDFTIENYKKILSLAKMKYRFITYEEADRAPKFSILLRHDIDWSLNKALEIALIENKIGIKSTYFVLPHSESYNLLDKESILLVQKILSLGHDIGIHIDFDFFNTYGFCYGSAEEFFEREISFFEQIIGTEFTSCSFHNPEANDVMDITKQFFCGKINTYCDIIKSKFKYCSDSNGYWRFEKLKDVIDPQYPFLHLLLHPVWWTSTVMLPAERIYSVLINRAKVEYCNYDLILRSNNRKNIGAERIEWKV